MKERVGSAGWKVEQEVLASLAVQNVKIQQVGAVIRGV